MGGSREDKRTEVENLARQGADLVRERKLKEAQHVFEQAYNCAKEFSDEKMEQICAFNVGAVYIALNRPEEGVKMLRAAEPTDHALPTTVSGDLYFNFALAYESLQDKEKAVKYYNDALELYEKSDDYPMQGDICVKLARICSQKKHCLEAADYYRRAAKAYGIHGNINKQVSSKCEQANELFNGCKFNEALSLAEDCLEKCSKLKGDEYLGFMYNDLGLIFTQCKAYGEAKQCFNRGLEETRKSNSRGDEKQEAMLLQNLGAIHNFLGEYQESLQIHEEAAAKYAKLKNRLCQGQCFSNCAFALSQMLEFEQAFEAFLHALQAAKDSDDWHSQWQIMEGLGVVAFIQGKIQDSIKFFKKSLTALSSTKDVPDGAQDRLVAKLSKALQFQMTAASNPGVTPVAYINGTQPTQTLVTSYGDKRVSAVTSLPFSPSLPVGQVVDGRFVPTRPGSRGLRFKSVPRGLSLDSMEGSGAVTRTRSPPVGGQVRDGLNRTNDPDPDISRYEEAIRRKEMEEISEEESRETLTEEETSSGEGSDSDKDSDSDEESDSYGESGSYEDSASSGGEHSPELGSKGKTATQRLNSTTPSGYLSEVRPSTSLGHTDQPISRKPNTSLRRRISGDKQAKTPLLDEEDSDTDGSQSLGELRTDASETPRKSNIQHVTLSEEIHENETAAETKVMQRANNGKSSRRQDDISEGTRAKRQSSGDESSDEEEFDEVAEEIEGFDEEKSEESSDAADHVTKAKPVVPEQPPPRTLNDTYETPVGNQEPVTPGRGPSPQYAEIDFSASGRLVKESSPCIQPLHRQETSNYFHSDDEGETKGLSTQPTLYEEEEEDPLYESIHPRDEGPGSSGSSSEDDKWTKLPRSETERRLFEEHRKQVGGSEAKNIEIPERKQRSGLCSVM